MNGTEMGEEEFDDLEDDLEELYDEMNENVPDAVLEEVAVPLPPVGKAPTFPVDDAWYSLSEINNIVSAPAPKVDLKAKKKPQLTCDLTFHDVLAPKTKLTLDDMLQFADALGYRYFVADNKVYEVKYEGDVTGAVDTGLMLEDINEIL